MRNSWMSFSLFLLLLQLFVLCCNSDNSHETLVTIDVHQAQHLIVSAGHRYVDVRTVEEFNDGHVDVKSALNIPYMFNTPNGRVVNPKFVEQVSSACSKDDYLVVGCQSGVRSVYASNDLIKAGFKQVRNMGGGYAAWLKHGLAVKKKLHSDL